jgi:hypothetical protein
MNEQAFARLVQLQPGTILYYMRDVGENALEPGRIWRGKLAINYLTHIPPLPGFVVEGLEEGLEMLFEVIHIKQVIMYTECNYEFTDNPTNSS